MSTKIGADIRALRKSRKLTLTTTAENIGRSPAWLSLVERGSTVPSVEDIGRIARFFGITISFFFRASTRSEDEHGVITRADDRMQIGTTESGLVEELLSPRLDGSFEIIKSTFAPRAASAGVKGGGAREDGGVLLSGQLTLIVGENRYDLAAGDSFQFSDGSYSWRNDGDVPAVVIWVVSPVAY